MSRAVPLLPLLALALAVALPASGQPARSSPPVLSTEASTPAGAKSEPAQMSGYALQVGDLPPGIVAVRVIRESFRTNVPDRPVLLRIGDTNRVLSATTNAEGRAQFEGLQIGEGVRIRADVGSEVLESQRFEIPSQGGVRMVLVAGVGASVASPADPWPSATARSSSVPVAPPPTPMTAPMAPPVATAAPAPARETPYTTSLGVAAAIGTGCLVLGVLLIRRRSRTAGHDSASAPAGRTGPVEAPAVPGRVTTGPPRDRAAIFEQLVLLEKHYRTGNTGGDDYSRRREALVDELVALDGASDADEPRRP